MPKKRKTTVIGNAVDNPDFMVYTDGGCAFNPGGTGGIGVIVINNATGEETELSRGYMATTNNRMEILAIIVGLEMVPDGARIRLYSDSQYALKCMSGEWSKHKNTDLWQVLDKVAKGKEIELRWVRGHNGNRHNERCDALATQGMQGPASVMLRDAGYERQAGDGRPERPEAAAASEVPSSARGQTRGGNNTKGSMAVSIIIPAELEDTAPDIADPGKYAAERGINRTCAMAIRDFYAFEGRGFRAYTELKTGGIDEFSRKRAAEIASGMDDGYARLQTIRMYADNERDVDAAIRWNARGLTLYDSIRKVLVDAEVRKNCG